ncbi:MAG: RHS repeat domain-containing protein [Eubacteriales bacterium]|nr:RHS repeat domain-containing protein [Eubacteriales bacterium]
MLKEEKLLFALNDVSDRQLEATRQRLGYGEKKTVRPRRRKLGRVLLLAAVLSALFAVTAYAAGWFGLGDLKAGTWMDAEISSLAGTMESPEGQALRDWLAVLSAHENDPYSYEEAMALGEEYQRYMATNPALAKELDAILEKYGLVKEGVMCVPEDEKSFYEAAGVGKLTRDTDETRNTFLSGYVYPVGSFHMEGTLYPEGEDYGVGYQLTRSVKGSFSMAMAGWADPDAYEEWDYTTFDGTPLHLALRRNGHGAMALLDGENSFAALNLLYETWVDHIGDGRIDGVGDEFIQLCFTRAQVETMVEAFRWPALEDPALGMDDDFSVPDFEPTGSVLDLVDKSLELNDLPEKDQYLISTAYTAQIEPYIEDFHLVDYQLHTWGLYATTGWIAFTGTPKQALDWATIETTAGVLYCRSLCLLPGGEDGLFEPGPSFDMLPYADLRQTEDVGENGEKDVIWLGTELKALDSATLYVQQLDQSFTIAGDALAELHSMLAYDNNSGNGSCRTWNPLFLDFTDGTHAVVYTLSDGSDGVNMFGEWTGYGYGKTIFELFGVPLEAVGYSHHDGLLTARMESSDPRFTGVNFNTVWFEMDFAENGPMLERRVMTDELRGRSFEYDQEGRLIRDTWWEARPDALTRESLYTYDESGRLVEMYSDSFSRGWEKTTYEYDEQGRLTAEIHTDNDDPPGWTGGNRYYTYDEAGNCRVHMGWQDLD